METIKILIADDHVIIHNGIEDILRSFEKYQIVGHAFNGKEAIEKTIEFNPDIIFMDLSMPVMSGIEAITILNEKFPHIKIIVLTQHDEQEYALHAFRSGGNGYLLKNSKKEEFVDAIETVLKNKRYISSELSERMIDNVLEKDSQKDKQPEVHLTRREIEIIRKIADDSSNQEIADSLNISLRTVETHRRNLMQKLKAKSVIAMLKYAVTNKLVDL